MGMFGGIESAVTSEKLPHLNVGLYTLEIDGVKQIKSRKGKSYFVTEFRIIEASGPGANTQGSTASWMVDMGNDLALGNVRGFLAAAMDVPDKTITEPVADDAVSTKQPLKGFLVKAEASVIKTKEGKDFTLVRYRPVPEQPKLAKTAAKTK